MLNCNYPLKAENNAIKICPQIINRDQPKHDDQLNKALVLYKDFPWNLVLGSLTAASYVGEVLQKEFIAPAHPVKVNRD